MKKSFRKINLKIFMHYFDLQRNNQRMYELHLDWCIHPSEKLFELTALKRTNSLLRREIQKLRETKIILSCG